MIDIKKNIIWFSGAIILSCLSFILVLFISSFALVSSISDNVNDAFSYKLQYQHNPHSGNIVIVKIDDKTLDNVWRSDLGMLAFDKWVYATALKNMFEVYNAWVVGIDIVFANSSVLGKEDEQKLAKVFETYKDRVVIASRSDYTPHPLCIYSGVQHGIVNVTSNQKIRSFQLEYLDYDISPYCLENEVLEENTNGTHIFSWEVIKKYMWIVSPIEKNRLEKSLKRFQDISISGKDNLIQFFHSGKNHKGTLWYESYSFSDILKGDKIDSDGNTIDLNNKIVLIGEVWTIMHDSHFTPVDRNVKMTWIEINANIASTLFSWNTLIYGSIYTMFFVYLLCNIFLIYCVFKFRFVFGFSALCTSSLIVIIFGSWMFYLGEVYNVFHMVFALILSYIIAYIYRFQVTDRSKRNLKKSFSLYVSPDVVDEITQDPKSVSTSGQKRDISIFFSDIVWFTSISESIKPEALLELLNEYFSEMTGILLKNKWTLDKYIWDAVMGFFNAPVLQENHSYFSCLTAVEQQKRLWELNPIWKEKWYPHIAVRIGIHTWEAIHGNIWSMDTRLNYTVIGDSVNLASRLEAIGKRYGIFTCVSKDVYELQKHEFSFRELDKITVKWKTIPVTIYELLGLKNDISITEEKRKEVHKYEQALHLYYDEKYDESIKILESNLLDIPSKMLMQRCKDVLSWKIEIHQGVFVMTEK
jgi:class 3 adenylate cyclase/CHASE2 domain-containing sensor protein